MKNTFDIETQCELSIELLYLLKWLVEHETSSLKKLINRAVMNGLTHEIQAHLQTKQHSDNYDAHYGIVDFLDYLDQTLHTALNQATDRKAHYSNLFPTYNKIDVNSLDTAIMRSSLDKTTQELDDDPQANAKELLLKEILKQWKPAKNKTIN